MTAKLACALILLAAAARVCAVTPSCDGPPYGDTPANYQAWAEQFATFPLGPPKGLLSEVCDVKFHHGDRARLHDLGLTDRVINDNSPVIVANYELAAIVRVARDPPETRVYAAAICNPNSNCQLHGRPHITGPDSFEMVPFDTLAQCRGYISGMTGGASANSEGRTPLPNGSWWECRSQHVDVPTWDTER